MCLNKLDEKARKRGGFGYKLLYRSLIGGLETRIQEVVPLTIGRWKADPNASETRHTETFGAAPIQEYPTGFHIFPTLEDLKRWQSKLGWFSLKVFKVQFKEVVASGYQRDCRVIVARKVKVIEEVV